METFDFCDTSLLSHFLKNQNLDKTAHRPNSLGQKSVVLDLIQRNFARSSLPEHRDPLQITKYDEKLVSHLKYTKVGIKKPRLPGQRLDR